MSRTTYLLGSSLTAADLTHNLHPTLHRLRASEPVSWLPALNVWLVTDYTLATGVMRDAASYTVDHPGFSTARVVGDSMLSKDGQEQQRHRTPFELPFRKREVEKRFRVPVAAHIQSLLGKLKPAGRADLRRDYAAPVAVKTMVTALGLDETAVQDVLGIYDAIVDAVTRVTAGEEVSAEGQEAFALLGETLLPSLKKTGDASLLSAASGAAQRLSEAEIISNAAVLLFGGIETTEGMIANAFYHLLTHPETVTELRRDPQLIAAVIEESLRLEPAATVVDRYATRDVTLAGADIKEGDLVRVSLAAANRDPSVFPAPDVFDISRDNLRSHVTFAQGPHVCLGLHLARLEAQLAVKEALGQLLNLTLNNSKGAKPTGLVFRKPAALDVSWSS